MSGIEISKTEESTFAAMLLDRRVPNSDREMVYKCMTENKNCKRRGFTVDQVRKIIEKDIEPVLQNMRDGNKDLAAFICQSESTQLYNKAMARERGERDVKPFQTSKPASRPIHVSPPQSPASTAASHNTNNKPEPEYIELDSDDGDDHGDDDRELSPFPERGATNPNPRDNEQPPNKRQRVEALSPPPSVTNEQHKEVDYWEIDKPVDVQELNDRISEKWGESLPESRFSFIVAYASTAIPKLAAAWIANFQKLGSALDINYFYTPEDEKLMEQGGAQALIDRGFDPDLVKLRQQWKVDN